MESIELLKSLELVIKGNDKISYVVDKAKDFITIAKDGTTKRVEINHKYCRLKIYDYSKGKYSYTLIVNKLNGLRLNPYFGEIVIETQYGSHVDRVCIRGFSSRKILKSIFNTICKRESDTKNNKYSTYISDIKTLIDPSIKRDGKIEDILK